jgi:outer membrane protein, heavy metal efflux system
MKSLILNVACWISASSSFAFELTEETVIQQINKTHPVARSYDFDVQAAEGELQQAKGSFDPTLKMNTLNSRGPYPIRYSDLSLEQPTSLYGSKWTAGVRKGLGDFPVYDEKMRTNDSGEARFGIEFPLLRNFLTDERRTRYELAKDGKSIANLQRTMQTQDLLRAGLYRYWEWIVAIKKQQLSGRLLEIARERETFLNHRILHGDAAKSESIDNDRVIAQRKALLISAERTRQKATLDLSLFLWENESSPVSPENLQAPSQANLVFPNTFPSISPDDIPEVIGLRLQRKQRAAEWRLADNQILPRLDASVMYARDYGAGNIKWNQSEFRFGLSLEFPLFFNVARGRKQTTFSRMAKAEIQERTAVERWKTEQVNLLQSELAIRNRYLLAKEELQLSQKIENLEKERFLHGDSSILILNLREQATIETEFKVLDLILEAKKISIDIMWSQSKIGST